MRAVFLGVAVALASCARPSPINHGATEIEHVKVHERIEIRLVAGGAVRAVVHEPSGTTFTVGGFPLQGATAVRLSARVAGAHKVTIYDGNTLVKTKTFFAEGVEGHGFVRVDAHDPHRFVFEDGTRFFMLGENRINVYDPSWNWSKLSIEDYLAKMAREGMTTLRVFVFTDCESEAGGRQLGCLEPQMGKFDERVAHDFDRIIEAAENNGLYVIVAPWAIGFTGGDEIWKSWSDNPYSKMVKTAPEFFEREDVRQIAKKKLQYVIDRWGYSTHLLAVDLINEPEWDGPIAETTWIPWAEKMAEDAHAMDPWRHLVTAGPVGLKWNVGEGDEKPWYASKRNDAVQFHLYGKEYYDPWDLATEMTRRIAEVWAFDKPVFCGEFGYGGEDPTTHDHTHVGIWSALMSGAGALSHTAPVFQIDSDEPMTPERGAHFRVLSNFMHSLDRWPDSRPRRDVTATPKGTRVWALRSDDDRWALWLLGPHEGYGTELKGVHVNLPSQRAFDVEWIDDVTGKIVAKTTTLDAPPFTRHLAARLVPRP